MSKNKFIIIITFSILLYFNYFISNINTKNKVFIMIISGRHNFEKRQNIRKTIGTNQFVKFMIGNRPCRVPPESRHSTIYFCFGGRQNNEYNEKVDILEQKLEEEKKVNSDIVELDMVDIYRSLPKKLKLSYTWVIENMPNVEWIFKTDDDCYFNHELIRNEFEKKRKTSTPVIYGHFRRGYTVQRRGKWEEFVYKKKLYPPFPKGSGYCINKAFAQYIASHNDELFEFQGEDVSIGIWSHETVEPKPALISMDNNLPDGIESCIKNKDYAFACGHDMTLENLEKIVQS